MIRDFGIAVAEGLLFMAALSAAVWWVGRWMGWI